MKRMLFAIFLAVLLVPAVSQATHLEGGIINSDTVWTLEDSPYTFTDAIEISRGVTLTIEPGVVVSAIPPSDTTTTYREFRSSIRVWGHLSAIGSNISNIYLNNITIMSINVDSNSIIDIAYSQIKSGEVIAIGSCVLRLTNSILEQSSIAVSPHYDDSYVERNVFIKSKQHTINPGQFGGTMYLRNNYFYEQSDPILILTDSGIIMSPLGLEPKFVIEYNTFESISKTAIWVMRHMNCTTAGIQVINPEIIAFNNYWGTTDTSFIDAMIDDRKDTLNCCAYVRYEPFLTAPHPNTPTLTNNDDRDPVIADIMANWSDGPIVVSTDTPVSISVTLDAGGYGGQNFDWWIAAETPFGWFSYVVAAGWSSGVNVCAQIPLFDLSSPIEFLNANLPEGDYTFFFAVDNNADGVPDATWWDLVEVHVQP